jgi:UPF0755 protein
MKKLVLIVLLVVVLAAAFAGWRFFTANTAFSEKSKFIYIPTKQASYSYLLQVVRDSQLVKNPGSFDLAARRLNLDQQVKPGRYEITNGMSIVEIVRLLRSGKQAPVNITINKVRTREGLASMFGRKYECDSADIMAWLTNPEALKKYELDTNTAMVLVYPNTYTYFWNSTPDDIFEKFYAEYKKVWNEERKQKAARLGLTPVTAYILASIVEEETNAKEEKGYIASVYLNRLKKGQRLEADPTVKYAVRDFGLKRIYEKHTKFASPYNTYVTHGLPPGPICTPSLETIDAVLDAPETNYFFFVAKSDFSGRHDFSETWQEHKKKANDYRRALTEQQKIRKAREKNQSKQ